MCGNFKTMSKSSDLLADVTQRAMAVLCQEVALKSLAPQERDAVQKRVDAAIREKASRQPTGLLIFDMLDVAKASTELLGNEARYFNPNASLQVTRLAHGRGWIQIVEDPVWVVRQRRSRLETEYKYEQASRRHWDGIY
jgi:hypothetical protein